MRDHSYLGRQDRAHIFILVRLNLQCPETLEASVKNERNARGLGYMSSLDSKIGEGLKVSEKRTGIHGFAFDPSCPATTFVPSRKLDELSSNFDIVLPILNNLATASSWVEFGPCIAFKAITLIARMTCT
jgi:hypothetical protein